MNVKDHYDNFLGDIYAWMVSDYPEKVNEAEGLLLKHGIFPAGNGEALDLGAAHGIYTHAMSRIGFKVTAMDFNSRLLDQLKHNCSGLSVETISDAIQHLGAYPSLRPECVICVGDTLAHLQTLDDIARLFEDVWRILQENGIFLLSFRDYTVSLNGNDRFIPVRSDVNRIMTCFLEYEQTHVSVTDIIYEKVSGSWEQKISAYKKIRLIPDEIISLLESQLFTITFKGLQKGLVTVIAQKRTSS
jgi:SAM-dependent methyltransferase